MRIPVLAPADVITADGASVPLGGPKPKTLLLALLQRHRHVVAAERIIELIWDESPPQSATASVHTYVSGLRRAIMAAGGVVPR